MKRRLWRYLLPVLFTSIAINTTKFFELEMVTLKNGDYSFTVSGWNFVEKKYLSILSDFLSFEKLKLKKLSNNFEKLKALNDKIYIFTKKKPFNKIGVLVNFIIQKMKSKQFFLVTVFFEGTRGNISRTFWAYTFSLCFLKPHNYCHCTFVIFWKLASPNNVF